MNVKMNKYNILLENPKTEEAIIVNNFAKNKTESRKQILKVILPEFKIKDIIEDEENGRRKT